MVMKYSNKKELLHSITYVIIDSYTVTSGVHIGPLVSWVRLGLRFPSGNVRGVKIPSNINLPKGLRSPWTVLRTIYTNYSKIKDASLWHERDYGSTSTPQIHRVCIPHRRTTNSHNSCSHIEDRFRQEMARLAA